MKSRRRRACGEMSGLVFIEGRRATSFLCGVTLCVEQTVHMWGPPALQTHLLICKSTASELARRGSGGKA